ncbi:coiled-coil-helix-coiled-coil-helix domain-containing protein 7-like [Haliotis rubra]|uniref:coiled-coil-helix-coiled-coil-helix domain-containing protein 7-like n=1 Tax=Haliotis rubra TaxID=36100 RepID=UPI001EE5E115|nr:coiled-coil-helix-coiled-coil-helix domain-containing protein 7-like [Haliotis rubra]
MTSTGGRAINENERQNKIDRSTRQASADKNPCMTEQKMSYKCLDDNGYDREKCSKCFQNYRNCREFWSRIMTDRKKKGIVPALPPVEERDKVRTEYSHILGW